MIRLCRAAAMLMALAFAGAASGAAARPASGAAAASPSLAVIDVVDAARRDPVDASKPRAWRIFLHYPARPCRGAHAYADDAALLDDLRKQNYYGQSDAALASWSRRATPDSLHCPARRGALTPLITLSPGMGVAAFNYALLADALVRSGFAVAIIDHPYLGIAHLADGRLLHPSDDPMLSGDDQEKWAPRIAEWVKDITVSLDRLGERGRLRAAAPGLTLDLRGVTSVGHSLGGAVALDACRADPRLSACADFEGAPLGTEAAKAGPARPTLFVLSRSGKPDRPQTVPDFSKPLFAFLDRGHAADAWAVSVTGGSHMSFSDAPFVMPDTLTRFGGSLMTAERSMQLYASMVAVFARAYRPGGGGAAAFRSWLDRANEVRAALAPRGGKR